MGRGNVGQRARLETAEVCNRGQRGKFNSRSLGRRQREKWSLELCAGQKGRMQAREKKCIGFLL